MRAWPLLRQALTPALTWMPGAALVLVLIWALVLVLMWVPSLR